MLVYFPRKLACPLNSGLSGETLYDNSSTSTNHLQIQEIIFVARPLSSLTNTPNARRVNKWSVWWSSTFTYILSFNSFRTSCSSYIQIKLHFTARSDTSTASRVKDLVLGQDREVIPSCFWLGCFALGLASYYPWSWYFSSRPSFRKMGQGLTSGPSNIRTTKTNNSVNPFLPLTQSPVYIGQLLGAPDWTSIPLLQ